MTSPTLGHPYVSPINAVRITMCQECCEVVSGLRNVASSFQVKEDFTKFFEKATTYTTAASIVTKNNGKVEVLVRIRDNEVINEDVTKTEAVDPDLEKRAEEWAKAALSIEVELPEDAEKSWDWVDEEYVRRKLGLLP